MKEHIDGQRQQELNEQQAQQSDKEQGQDIGFEQTLELIEEKIEQLGKTDLPLAEAFAEYEEGVKLLRLAQDMLDTVEKQVVYLKEGELHEL